MGRVIHIACLGAGFASGLLAQLPPCYPAPPAADPSFGATALSTPGFTVSEVAQLELKPTTTPGTYILSATVRFSSGGAGGFDLLMGQWNAATGFTKSNWVDGLNTSADEFALTLNSNQTSVAFDRYPGNAIIASRPSLTSPFTGAVAVAGLPLGGVDPAFGRFGAQDVLFWFDGPGNIKLLAGRSGSLTLTDQRHMPAIRAAITRASRGFDAVVCDTGAGIGPAVLETTMRASLVLAVTTPDPAAVTDTYALTKILKQAGQPAPHLVVNRVRDRDHAMRTATKLSTVAMKFLGIRLPLAGWLRSDPAVERSVLLQRPFVLEGEGAAMTDLRALSAQVLSATPGATRTVVMELLK